jgi:hypothetical protein
VAWPERQVQKAGQELTPHPCITYDVGKATDEVCTWSPEKFSMNVRQMDTSAMACA